MLLLGAIVNSGDFVVGENEPYPIEADVDYTIPLHGEGRGLPSVMIEIRQDGIREIGSADVWAVRLAQAYRRIEAEALRLFGPTFARYALPSSS
jgi:predicted N-formylglutamate amidohydrolase